MRAGVDSIEHGLYLTPYDLDSSDPAGSMGADHRQYRGRHGTIRAEDRLRDESSEPEQNVQSLLPKAAGAGVAVLAGTDLGLRHGAVAMEALRLHSYGLDGPSLDDAAGPAAYRYLGLEPASPAPRPTLSSLPTTLRPIPPFFCRPWRG